MHLYTSLCVYDLVVSEIKWYHMNTDKHTHTQDDYYNNSLPMLRLINNTTVEHNLPRYTEICVHRYDQIVIQGCEQSAH